METFEDILKKELEKHIAHALSEQSDAEEPIELEYEEEDDIEEENKTLFEDSDDDALNPDMPPVREATKTFKVLSDITRLNIVNEVNNEVLVEISGYDLEINFNFKYIKTMQDVEAACEGIKSLFRESIMEQLLGKHEQSEEA